MTKTRKGQAKDYQSREQFRHLFHQLFFDPSFSEEAEALTRIEEIAWRNYRGSHKAPKTREAGTGFTDPTYQLSEEWLTARADIEAAAERQRNPASPSRALVICASARNDGTCPGEMSKSYRMSQLAIDTLHDAGVETDLLDLSLVTSDFGRTIYPCKGCVSTAMPLCHWPCSCYPNHALGQVNDWMAEIYARWIAAHGILIVTPVYWFQVSSPLKLMMDRLVCADGGNPDPTLTSGKNAEKAKDIELRGWNYPKHFAGRVYGVVVHGDVAGIEAVRRALCDWLDWMELIDAGPKARIDRMIGYYEPYATSHDAFDRDAALNREVRDVAKALGTAISMRRKGSLVSPDQDIRSPRPK